MKHLYTLRKGEPAWENIRGEVAPLEAEIIKIREADGGRACRFFNDAEKGCAIYENRPMECRILKCWDTAEIEAMYRRDRLSRQHLLGTISGLWDLAATHEKECGLDRIGRLMAGDDPDRGALARIMAYDREMRNLVTERSGIDPEILDFLFGRPLARIMPGGRFRRRFGPFGGSVSPDRAPTYVSDH